MTTTLRTAGGDLVIPRVIVTDFASVVRQTILDGLALFQGEWFLNQNDGFPWFQSVFGVKLTTAAQVDALLRAYLLGVPGVASVVAATVFNRALRLFSYTFQAFLSNSQTLNGSSSGPTITVTGP